MSFFFNFLEILCEVLTLIIFLRVLMTWIMPGQVNMFTNLLYQVTEPILGPLRRILPKVGMFDFSPLAAIIILQILSSVLSRL